MFFSCRAILIWNVYSSGFYMCLLALVFQFVCNFFIIFFLNVGGGVAIQEWHAFDLRGRCWCSTAHSCCWWVAPQAMGCRRLRCMMYPHHPLPPSSHTPSLLYTHHLFFLAIIQETCCWVYDDCDRAHRSESWKLLLIKALRARIFSLFSLRSTLNTPSSLCSRSSLSLTTLFSPLCLFMLFYLCMLSHTISLSSVARHARSPAQFSRTRVTSSHERKGT